MSKNFKFGMSFETKSVSEKDDVITIRGMANTANKDRAGDIIPASVWPEAIKGYNGVILAAHDHSRIVGKATKVTPTAQGLEIEAEVYKGVEAGDITYNQVKKGIVSSFSVGFRAKDGDYAPEDDTFTFKDIELYEVSIVAVPCERNARFSVKSYEEKDVTNNDESMKTSIVGLRKAVLDQSTALSACNTVTGTDVQTALIPYAAVGSDASTFTIEIKGKKVAVARSHVTGKITETTKEDLNIDPTSTMNSSLVDVVRQKLEKQLATQLKAKANTVTITGATGKVWDTIIKAVESYPEVVRKTQGDFHVFLNDITYRAIMKDHATHYNYDVDDNIVLHSVLGMGEDDMVIAHENGLFGRVQVDRATAVQADPKTESYFHSLGYYFGLEVDTSLVKKLAFS